MKKIKYFIQISMISLTVIIVGIYYLHPKIISYSHDNGYKEVYRSVEKVSNDYQLSIPTFLDEKFYVMESSEDFESKITQWIQNLMIDQNSKDKLIQTLNKVYENGKNIMKVQSKFMSIQCLYMIILLFDIFFIIFYLYTYKILHKSGN